MIPVIAEDRLALVAARGDVVTTSGVLNAQGACHGQSESRWRRNVKAKCQLPKSSAVRPSDRGLL